ncbi:unnamed protein product [Echinostoma caproni]|uniref:Uncharacterized protein n=1 Tax=Echinostoma caproni TaxID=27848 RepID=A0A183BDJ1_9TREM|nr:unnamed protein product [Echinostoma caproni]
MYDRHEGASEKLGVCRGTVQYVSFVPDTVGLDLSKAWGLNPRWKILALAVDAGHGCSDGFVRMRPHPGKRMNSLDSFLFILILVTPFSPSIVRHFVSPYLLPLEPHFESPR